MGRRFDRTAVERVSRPAALIEVVMLAVVVQIGLTVGWRELDRYGKALELIGVVVILNGGAILFIGPSGVDSWTYRPPRGLDIGAHMARVSESIPSGIGCASMLIAAGVGALVAGLVLQSVG